MFVALGLAIIGMAYGRIKTKEFVKLHRWIMGGSVVLVLVAIFFVMIPSIYLYYITPGNSYTSTFSVLQIVHSILGAPAIVLGVMYLFNDLPQATKKWMRVAIVFWLVSIALGAVVYYAMPS